MDLPCVVLSEVHYLIPVGVKAVVGQGRLHLLGVEEVKVRPVEFAFELFNFKLLLQLSLFHCSLIIIHYKFVEIRLFLLPLYLIFSISITSLFVCNQVGLGLLSLLLLLNSVISDSVELYFADYTLKQKKKLIRLENLLLTQLVIGFLTVIGYLSWNRPMNSLVLARFLNRSFMIPYALKKCEKLALFLVGVVFSVL